LAHWLSIAAILAIPIALFYRSVQIESVIVDHERFIVTIGTTYVIESVGLDESPAIQAAYGPYQLVAASRLNILEYLPLAVRQGPPQRSTRCISNVRRASLEGDWIVVDCLRGVILLRADGTTLRSFDNLRAAWTALPETSRRDLALPTPLEQAAALDPTSLRPWDYRSMHRKWGADDGDWANGVADFGLLIVLASAFAIRSQRLDLLGALAKSTSGLRLRSAIKVIQDILV
jgi:hypothetical protein